MKKLIEDKSILYAIIGLILGISITGVVAYSVYANKVTYDNTQSGSQSTNVQGAIDELYTKANNMVPIDPDTFNTNTAKTVYASKLGVCIRRNNKLNCFKINNWEEEKNHVQQVFSDISCTVNSSRVRCNGSDFICNVDSSGGVYSSGYVGCSGLSDNSYCIVFSDGSVNCT